MGPAFVPCSAQIRHKVLEENTWVVHILRSRAQKTKETEGEKGRWQVPRRCPAGAGTHTLLLIEEDLCGTGHPRVLSNSCGPASLESAPTLPLREAPASWCCSPSADNKGTSVCLWGSRARGGGGGPQSSRSCVFANRGAELCRGAESTDCL